MADLARIEDLRRRVQKDPASIAFAQLAEELRRAGEFAESVDTCRAGLALHPGYLSARVTLGRALLEMNELEEAKAELELVLKSAPENLAAIRGLAEVFHRQGQLKEALAQYRAALSLAKNDPDLQQTVAELAREIEPTRPPTVEGLSFEQIQSELLANVPPPVPRPAPAPQHVDAAAAKPSENAPATLPSASGTLESAPSTLESAANTLESAPSTLDSAPSTLESEPGTPESAPVQSSDQEGHARAQQTIEALEQWLDAIHVARTDRGA